MKARRLFTIALLLLLAMTTAMPSVVATPESRLQQLLESKRAVEKNPLSSSAYQDLKAAALKAYEIIRYAEYPNLVVSVGTADDAVYEPIARAAAEKQRAREEGFDTRRNKMGLPPVYPHGDPLTWRVITEDTLFGKDLAELGISGDWLASACPARANEKVGSANDVCADVKNDDVRWNVIEITFKHHRYERDYEYEITFTPCARGAEFGGLVGTRESAKCDEQVLKTRVLETYRKILDKYRQDVDEAQAFKRAGLLPKLIATYNQCREVGQYSHLFDVTAVCLDVSIDTGDPAIDKQTLAAIENNFKSAGVKVISFTTPTPPHSVAWSYHLARLSQPSGEAGRWSFQIQHTPPRDTRSETYGEVADCFNSGDTDLSMSSATASQQAIADAQRFANSLKKANELWLASKKESAENQR